jgi:hypothetical protein
MCVSYNSSSDFKNNFNRLQARSINSVIEELVEICQDTNDREIRFMPVAKSTFIAEGHRRNGHLSVSDSGVRRRNGRDVVESRGDKYLAQ